MTTKISNPISTSNAGGTYENRVQAAHLLAMLIGVPLAGLPDYRVVSIKFQARIYGIETDDLVCTLESPYGSPCKRLIQIKRTLETSAGNTSFRQAISRAWADYSNSGIFNRSLDSISIICDYQAGISTREAKTIVDFARSSLTTEEFLRKIQTPRFSSEACRESYSEIKTAIFRESVESAATDDESIFHFLKHVHFQNYELASESGELLSSLLGLIDINKSSDTPAHAIWSELVLFAAELNQQAGSVSLETWSSLAPTSLAASFAPISSGTKVLGTLHARRELMDSSIQDSLPNGISIERRDVLDEILETVRTTPLTIVVGDAGCGKSALTKRASKILDSDGFSLFFKAEDFDHSSLHAALAALGSGNPSDFIRFNLVFGQQNLIFIDGVEKIVEFSSQEAFAQLIAVLKQSSSWKLCVTVRSHAVQPLCDVLFMGLPYRFVKVKSLTDSELDEVVSKTPEFNSPPDASLRSVLRIPFYLKLAVGQIKAGADALPTKGNQLKRVLWANAVAKPLEARDGLPTRRRTAFKTICFDRAKRVAQYVLPPSDSAAVTALIRDQILLEDANGLVTPAHDIFDDWALTEIIETTAQDSGRNWPAVFDKLGLHPGIRRAFRRWVADEVHCDESNSAAALHAALTDASLPQQWRDDAVVGMLQSATAPSLIAHYESVLVANQYTALKRLVHLLRVACRGPRLGVVNVPGDSALMQVIALRHIFTAPVGNAWLPIISLIYRHASELDTKDITWLTQLLSDSLPLLSNDELDGELAEQATLLALELLNKKIAASEWHYERSGTKELLDTVLTLAGRASKNVESFFDDVLKAYQNDGTERDKLEILARCIDGHHSVQICRHIPRLAGRIFNAIVYKSPSTEQQFYHRLDIPELFGISPSLRNYDYRPASALQGPFLYLLHYHPYFGANLILDFCNRAAESYSRSELGNEVSIVNVPFNRKGNLIYSWRLWGLYRGMHVGPELLCSALMALEKYLLQAAQLELKGLEELLEYILEQGTSALTISVLASVITARPNLATSKLIGILEVPMFFQADIVRRAGENAVEAGQNMFSGLSAGKDSIHRGERKSSNKEGHRQRDLEDVVFQLQFTPHRDRILALLDRYRDELPDVEEQSEVDRRWRLALHRMDARQKKVGQRVEQGVLIESLPPPADLQPMVNQAATELTFSNDAARVQLWALSHFPVGKVEHRSYVSDWREALRLLRYLRENDGLDEIFHASNIDALVAATLLQSYTEEIGDELRWAIETCVRAICDHANTHDQYLIVSKNLNDGARFAVFVLPLLLKIEDLHSEVCEVLAIAMTHSIYEMRECAAAGVRRYLWGISDVAAESCVAAMLLLGKAVDDAMEGDFDGRQERAHAAVMGIRKRLSQALVHSKKIEVPQLSRLPYTWPEPITALNMLSYDSAPEFSASVTRSLVALLLNGLADDENSARGTRHTHEVHYELKQAVLNAYADCLHQMQQFDMRDAELIRRMVAEQPDSSVELMQKLITSQDKQDKATQFWVVWDVFFAACLAHLQLDGTTQRRYFGDYEKLLQALLFHRSAWREGATSWAALRNRPDLLTKLPAKLVETQACFEAVCALLAGIGQETLLPDGLTVLDAAISRATGNLEPFKSNDAVLNMEIVLRKVVVSSTSRVRADAALKGAILRLLDELVNVGSSIAFQLRDYLATPALRP